MSVDVTVERPCGWGASRGLADGGEGSAGLYVGDQLLPGLGLQAIALDEAVNQLVEGGQRALGRGIVAEVLTEEQLVRGVTHGLLLLRVQLARG